MLRYYLKFRSWCAKRAQKGRFGTKQIEINDTKALWNWFWLVHIVLSARWDLLALNRLWHNADRPTIFWWYQVIEVLYVLVSIKKWFSVLKGWFWYKILIFAKNADRTFWLQALELLLFNDYQMTFCFWFTLFLRPHNSLNRFCNFSFWILSTSVNNITYNICISCHPKSFL